MQKNYITGKKFNTLQEETETLIKLKASDKTNYYYVGEVKRIPIQT